MASCLPGASLTEETGPDQYTGNVNIRLGPVQMQFAGQAAVRHRDEENRTIVVDAAGADQKGRGQANVGLTARLVPTANGTRVEVEQDLELSGAAAQYGRGMVNDVSAIMLRDFAANMQARIEAYDKGLSRWTRSRSEGRRGLRDRFPGSLDGAEASGPPVLHALSTQSDVRRKR